MAILQHNDGCWQGKLDPQNQLFAHYRTSPEIIFHQGDDGKGGDVGSGSSDDKVGKNVNQDCINRFNLLIQGSPSGGGGSKGGDKLLCPKCGSPCEHVATFITSTRYSDSEQLVTFSTFACYWSSSQVCQVWKLLPLLCGALWGWPEGQGQGCEASGAGILSNIESFMDQMIMPDTFRVNQDSRLAGNHLPTPKKSTSTSTIISLDKSLPRRLWRLLCTTTTRGSTTTYQSTKRWIRWII